MIPYEIYEVESQNLFPSINLLIMIFGIAFIYVFFETIFLWIKDKNKFEKIKLKKHNKEEIKNFIIQYFMGYFIITFFNNLINKYLINFGIYNQGLLMICNMLLLLFLYRIIKTKKQKLWTLIIAIISNLIYYSIFGFKLYNIDYKILLIVLFIMIFRDVAEKYNYEEIEVEKLKPRMILSYGSVFKFYSSRVKGLPQTTTETTDSRLTKEEVESIKRWSKTKKGEKTITIVRHMPFAPFILAGEILFFILKVYF